MNLKKMMKEKVHQVIFENQSSAIRGSYLLVSHIMICTQTTKQKGKQEEQASRQGKRDISNHLFSVSLWQVKSFIYIELIFPELLKWVTTFWNIFPFEYYVFIYVCVYIGNSQMDMYIDTCIFIHINIQKETKRWKILFLEKTACTGGQNFLFKLLVSNLLMS